MVNEKGYVGKVVVVATSHVVARTEEWKIKLVITCSCNQNSIQVLPNTSRVYYVCANLIFGKVSRNVIQDTYVHLVPR